MVVYKYDLAFGETVIQLGDPSYKILHVGEQNGHMRVWIMHNPNLECFVEVKLKVVGTGSPTDCRPMNFVGTIQMADGHVWHIFKV